MLDNQKAAPRPQKPAAEIARPAAAKPETPRTDKPTAPKEQTLVRFTLTGEYPDERALE